MRATTFQLTIRRFSKQKLNTALHIIGLTLGMSVCLLIGLFLCHELSFDTWQTKADRTYRVNFMRVKDGEFKSYYATQMPLAEVIRNQVPGIEEVVQAHPLGQNTVVKINSEKRFKQDHILITGPEFIDAFDVKVLKGNAREAMMKPYQALLTEATAKKFFGKEYPVGKTFLLKNQFTITVAGLIGDLPANTHLPASMLLSYVPEKKYLDANPDSWSSLSGTSTFIVVPKNSDLNSIKRSLASVATKNLKTDPRISSFYNLQTIGSIHFTPEYDGGGNWVKAVNTSWLWFFGAVGFAVLILACINFVNLSTAQAFLRAKEVGVRKAVGAGSNQLIGQFLSEAWLLALISGILAIIITTNSLPVLNNMLDKGITFNMLESPVLIAIMVLGVFITGLLAGLYPAWSISRINPVNVLKTGMMATRDQGSVWLRKGLVVTQFTISAGFLIALLLIAQQVKYMHGMSLGFDKENIISVRTSGNAKLPVFASELTKIPNVKEFSFATATPSSEQHWGTLLNLPNADRTSQQVVTIMADENYCKMYGLKLLSGRFPTSSDTNYLSSSIPKEKQVIRVVVNETLVKSLGFASNHIAPGKIFWCGVNDGNAEIVGVVADFNTNSLHDAVKPTLITPFPSRYGQAGIKIATASNLPQTLAAIEKAWRKAYPEGVFEFNFLDEQIDAFYKEEARLFHLFKIFSGLAMLISCLGLWGLATFASQQRVKEIGIRKVLGASVNSIVLLLAKDFLKLVSLAFVIASPFVWYSINQWLQDFAYRINISLWVFVLSGLTVISIALLTVSFQAIKAAIVNPVKSLKSE